MQHKDYTAQSTVFNDQGELRTRAVVALTCVGILSVTFSGLVMKRLAQEHLAHEENNQMPHEDNFQDRQNDFPQMLTPQIERHDMSPTAPIPNLNLEDFNSPMPRGIPSRKIGPHEA